jgi:hypothetical protein
MFEIDIDRYRFVVDVTRYISDKPHNGPASTCDTLDDMYGNTEVEFEVVRVTDLELDGIVDDGATVSKMTTHFYEQIHNELIKLIQLQSNDDIIRGFK